MARLLSHYMRVKVSTLRQRNARRNAMGNPTGVSVSVKFIPSTKWRRLLIEWGVIHHIWTENGGYDVNTNLYALRLIRQGNKVIKVFPPRWA